MDPILILLVVVLGVFIVFQTVQGRKRRRETEERTAKFVPGIEIMTNYGLYGTILSIDDDTNVAVIETSPGVTLKIHRQTILKVADYDTPAEVDADAVAVDETVVDAETGVPVENDTAARLDEPAFGERIDEPGKPVRPSDTRASDSKADD